MTPIGWILLWCLCSVLVALLWAAAFGGADLDDDNDRTTL